MRMFLFAAAITASSFGVFSYSLAAIGAFSPSETAEATRSEMDLALEGAICNAEPTQPAAHSHAQIEVSKEGPMPTVTHLVFPDEVDGYNVQILLENFDFTPAAINREIVANSGHGHLYINGEKYGRIYSEWIHVPSDKLRPGPNVVSVTLNANDHSEWAVNGATLQSSVTVNVSY